MPNPRSLAIVLPAYNEAERIGPALDELFGYLRGCCDGAGDGSPGAPAVRGLPDRIDVLVVDDGSTDGTAELVRARPEAVAGAGPSAGAGAGAATGAGPSAGAGPAAGTAAAAGTATNAGDHPCATLRVISMPHDGKGAAVRAGMLAADAEVIVFTDADMATPPDQMPLLVAALADHDVAFGSRIQPDGSDMRASQPTHRRLLGKAFHLLASIWAVGPVQDTQCGFKGFRREAAHDLFGMQRVTSIVFDVEVIYLARRRGYRMAIVPIRWVDVHGSRMRTRPRLAARVAWDLFRIPLIHRRVPRRERDAGPVTS